MPVDELFIPPEFSGQKDTRQSKAFLEAAE